MGERIPDVSKRVAERVEDVRAEEGVDGRITLRRRRFGAVKAKLVGAAGIPADLTVHLDPLGTAAWRLMDGRRTVGEIRAGLGRDHPEETDLGPRLGKFLGAMVSNGFVRLR
ncbi:MAG TPA: PqqD family protein [Candidatus Thermoplasmatota archaeon]|nr:PqqD family protein [Candidatus Thermoplasmatota archaeon]